MKNNIIFKIICFISIPILIIAVVLSMFAVYVKNGTAYNEDKYYASRSFCTYYMEDMSDICEDLIYKNENYFNINDGDKTIYVTSKQNYNSNVKDLKYIAIYKNKAITNINTTKELNTIDSIKEYIENLQGYKKVNLVDGFIESDSEVITKNGTNYLEYFIKKYYSKEKDETIYYTTKYTDFEIYTAYEEGFSKKSKEVAITEMIKEFPPIDKGCYVIIPLGSVITMLMLIYLTVSIGEKENLNYFDKIPLEIVGFISITIATIPFIILSEYYYSTDNDYIGGISIITTIALIIYVIACIFMITVIRRLKAKKFWKTTLTGKFFYWFKDVFFKNLSYSLGVTAKVIILAILIGLSIIIIKSIFFGFLRIVALSFLYGYIVYRVIRFLKECKKIEKRLEEIKEGKNQEMLDTSEFSHEFQNVAKSINNISEGIETAVQERIKSERLKAELITNVSHDIKTPLTSIINYVDLLKNEKIENEKAKEYIEILDSKSQRLKRLTEDLIEASKIQTGNVTLNKERINIVELIKQALGEFEDKFNQKKLIPIIDCGQKEVYIYADSRYMYRIIENLFSNVSKYAMENSRVYIDINVKNDEAIIEVKNISKEKLNISADELMQRFVRGESSRTTEGSGLGISIAQNLTNLQGGNFDLILDGDLFKIKMKFKIF